MTKIEYAKQWVRYGCHTHPTHRPQLEAWYVENYLE
jgi:hypothetical protein